MSVLKKTDLPFLCLLAVVCGLTFSSCKTIDLYEKDVAIPEHQWKASFKPEFKFIIKDTTVPYSVYIVLRHTDRYNFNNIWLNLSTRTPGDSVVQKAQYELPLANSEGWLGSAASMDDLYEHRILITPRNEPVYFRKAGEYTFIIEQIMREDPLENVLNIGLRIEKKP